MSDAFSAHNELMHRLKVSDALATEIVEILRTSLAPAIGKALIGAEEAGRLKERRRCLEIAQAEAVKVDPQGDTFTRLARMKALILAGK